MKSDTNSTFTQTLILLDTFLTNTYGYLLLYIPLLIVYEIYKRIYSQQPSKVGNGVVYRFLNLFAFGNVRPRDTTDDSSSLSSSPNGPLLPVADPSTTESGKRDSSTRTIFTFILCFLGLQFSFVLWGLMQERIIKYGYTKELNKQELSRFKNSQFLVLCNRLAGFILACVILAVFNERREIKTSRCGLITIRFDSISKLTSFKNFAPLFICSFSSLSNVLSSWCQYESLKYVSFTSQLLAKSSKSVFVMITGKFVSNKKYKSYEYLCVGIIGMGIFMFSDLGEQNLSKTGQMIKTTFPGLLCLLGYLISDSFTSTWQDNLIRNYYMSSVSLMLLTNLYSSAYTFVSLIFQGELFESLSFLSQHSDITFHVLLLSLTSAIGQIFIFVTIQEFGALVFSLMMTTRQIISILLSSIVFQHSLSFLNYFGIFLIFFALFLQHYFKLGENNKKINRPISRDPGLFIELLFRKPVFWGIKIAYLSQFSLYFPRFIFVILTVVKTESAKI